MILIKRKKIKPYYKKSNGTLYCGDVIEVLSRLPNESVQCCMTSPPYWGLRDYGVDGQIGLEPTPEEYVAKMVDVFREVRRVLRDDGCMFLNLGDSYARDPKKGDRAKYLGLHKTIVDSGCHKASQSRTLGGLKPKDLVGIPWRVAFALQADGWYLRSDIIWHKPNPMPESVTDRPTKAHEYIFLMSKSQKYFYDADAIKEPLSTKPHSPGNKNIDSFKTDTGHLRERIWGASGFRNRRSVWTIATAPFPEAHFATFPEALVRPCILAGSSVGSVVLDPFGGALTVAKVCNENERSWVCIELNSKYCDLGIKRIEAPPKQKKKRNS